MPRLAICSRDLHWQWINWPPLYDTMEVSMLRLTWLTVAQHVFQPALTGRLELISRKIVSCEPGTKAIAVSRFREKLSPANWVQGVTAISRKISRSWAPKNGVQHATAIYPIPRYTRPRYIGLTLYVPSKDGRIKNKKWWFLVESFSQDLLRQNMPIHFALIRETIEAFWTCLHLTHLPLVPHMCVSELGQHWFRQWFVAYSAPSHYLNQCWVIVNWTVRNKLQWNFNQNIKLFIHENASENIVCEMAAILSRVRWVNQSDQWTLSDI